MLLRPRISDTVRLPLLPAAWFLPLQTADVHPRTRRFFPCSMRFPIAAVIVLLALLPTAASAAPWYSPVPVTAGATIFASVQGGNQTVFVGGAGMIATSANRRDWTRRASGMILALYSVAYGAGRFVAVGEQGTILSSVDGAAWSVERHPYTGSLAPDINGITYANGRFVAVSRTLGFDATGNIITSTDGRTWVRQTVDRGGFQLQFVTFANGLYVAGGGGVLMVSADAATWRTVWTGQSWLYAGVRGESRWVVFGSDGSMLTSTDGASWTESPLGQRATLFGVAYRNGRYLGVGSNAFTIAGNNASVFSSVDGLAWTALPFPETAAITRRDVFRSLLVTETGFLGLGSGGLIAETVEGASWNLLSQPADRPHFQDVVYGNGLFVAVGDKSTNQDIPGINQGRIGAVYTSADGWNWQEQTSGVRGSILRQVAFGSGRFVAVGTGGVVVYSEDGATWHRAVHPVQVSWAGIAYGAGRFVAVGGGTMISRDGVIWETQAATAGNTYSAIRFVNDSFFLSVSPFSGPVQRSADGVNWSGIALASASAINDLAFHGGLWVAATSGGATVFEGSSLVATGALQVSADGNQWTALRTPYLGTMRSVQRLNDRWVAGTGDGAIFSSVDGRTWRLEERPTSNGILRFAVAGDYAVAVGDSGTLLTTRDPRTLPAVVRPTIAAAPVAQTVTRGQPLRLAVTVLGTPVPALQWTKDGVAIPGATSAVYAVAAADESDGGSYAVIATNAGGSVTSPAVLVNVLASRIVNLSIRSALSAASPELTVGFFASGSDKLLLVRAVGPALAQFGVSSALARPGLGIYAGQTPLATNEGWDRAVNAAQVDATTARVGAFSLSAASNDAAVLQSFGSGNYSAVVQSRGGAPGGTVLIEIYDADSGGRGRLTNVSALAPVGTGDNILVAGFVLSGNAAKRLLIRAIGPGLISFGRTAALADPQLAVIPAGAQAAIAANDNWGGGEGLSTSFQSVGAFPIAASSRDAAVVLSLEPGAYTVQVSGVGGTTGDALVEIYELPE